MYVISSSRVFFTCACICRYTDPYKTQRHPRSPAKTILEEELGSWGESHKISRLCDPERGKSDGDLKPGSALIHLGVPRTEVLRKIIIHVA